MYNIYKSNHFKPSHEPVVIPLRFSKRRQVV